MRDINIEFEKDVSGFEYKVVYSHPKNFIRLPVISYYNLTDTSSFSCDNDECIQEGVIQADIWADKPKQCGEISLKLYERLKKCGWIRDFAMDVPDDKIYHRTMRFRKLFI